MTFTSEQTLRNNILLVLQIRQVSFTSTVISNSVQSNSNGEDVEFRT